MIVSKQTHFGEVPTSVNKAKGNVKEFFGKLSQGLMLPISMLPIAGIMIGLGSIFSDNSIIHNTGVNIFGKYLEAPGKIVFSALPGLFAISIAVKFTKDSGPAGVCAFLGWLIFNAFQSALISVTKDGDVVTGCNFLFYHLNADEYSAIFTTNIGIPSLSTSVFGGIIIGTITAFAFNKFKNIQLPNAIGFFSGIRFVPIVLFGFLAIVSILFAIGWPIIGIGLYNLGIYMAKAPGGLNSFGIAFMNRALLPFGLHFIVTTLVNYTVVGGVFHLDWQNTVLYHGEYFQLSSSYETWATYWGETSQNQINGENLIQWYLISKVGVPVDLYQNGDLIHSNVKLTVDMIYKGVKDIPTANNSFTFIPGQYTAGASSVMMFCLPATAFAMLTCAPKGDNRKLASSILLSSAFVSFFTGITEPLEFTFLFIAPWLYWGFHAIMYGVAAMINTIFILYTPYGPHVVGACFLDDVFYSLVPEIKGGGINLWVPLLVGIALSPIYFFFFRWAILKFDLATPGRGGNTKLFTKADFKKSKESKHNMNSEKANAVIKAYGGKDNIVDVGACFTKLRVTVIDVNKVDKQKLKDLGAHGVIQPSPKAVYAVFGTEADVLKNMMKDLISKENEKPIK